MNKLQLPVSMLICGKPKSGKSHTIKYLLYKFTARKDLYKRFSYGLVFCKTAFNKSYNYIPSSWVYNQFVPEALENLMKIQKGIRANGYIPPHAFVVFDDCLGNKQFKCDLFKDLVQNYRHYNISPFISTQYINRIETVNRECVSHAVIFKQFSKPAIESIYNSFGQRFDSEKQFKQYLNNNTGNFNFIFVNNESLDDNINKQYSIMKCPAHIDDPYVPYVGNIDVNNLKSDSD